MKKSTIIWIVCGVLAVAIAGLITWRVLTPPDREFLKVCWTPDRDARYLDIDDGIQGTCSNVQEIKWKKDNFPLTVEVVTEVDAINQIVNAIRAFNTQAGWTVFRVKLWNDKIDSVSSDVAINWNVPYGTTKDEQAAGSVAHFMEDGKLYADVNIRATVYPYVHAVLLHELGHVVGLPHAPAEDRINIMEAKLPNWNEKDIDLDLGLRKFSSDDKELLRKAYQ